MASVVAVFAGLSRLISVIVGAARHTIAELQIPVDGGTGCAIIRVSICAGQTHVVAGLALKVLQGVVISVSSIWADSDARLS